MGKENEGQGGGEGAGEGEGQGSGQNQGSGGGKGDVVSRADHERALADLHKLKTTNKELADQAKAANEKKLLDEKKFEELANSRKTEAENAIKERDTLKQAYLNDKKFSALHVKAMALGLREEALSDLEGLDLEDIEVETTNTGKVNVLGVDKFAERLKATKPHWFTDGKTPKVDAKGRRIQDSGGKITIEDVLAAQAEGKKTGDNSKYYDLSKKYQQQKLAGR